MNLFQKLYRATDETKKLLQLPLVEKKIRRALDGAVDSYEQQKIDTQEKIDAQIDQLVRGETGVISELIRLRLTMAEICIQSAEAAKIKEELLDKEMKE